MEGEKDDVAHEQVDAGVKDVNNGDTTGENATNQEQVLTENENNEQNYEQNEGNDQHLEQNNENRGENENDFTQENEQNPPQEGGNNSKEQDENTTVVSNLIKDTLNGNSNESERNEQNTQDIVDPPQIPGSEDVGKEQIQINEQTIVEDTPQERDVPHETMEQNEPETSSTEKKEENKQKTKEVEQSLFPTQPSGSEVDSKPEPEPEHQEPKPARSPRPPTTARGTRTINENTSARVTSPRRTFRRAPPPVEVDKAKVDALSKKFIKNETIKETDPIVLAAVIVDLESKRNEMMANGQSRESVKVQIAIEKAKQEQRKAAMIAAQKEKNEKIDEKIRETKDRLFEVISESKEKEKELDEEIKKQTEDLKKKQSEELADFDTEWTSEAKSRRYNRASQKLKMLKVQQMLLLNAKRFDEADKMNRTISQQEQFEISENARAMQLEYITARKQLLEKHQNELTTLHEAQVAQKEVLTNAYQHKISIHARRQKILEDEKELAQDPEKVWQTSHRNDPDPKTLVARPKERSAKPFKNSTQPGDFALIHLPPLKPPGTPRQKKE